MIQFRFKLFQAFSFLFIAVAISHCLLAVVHASPIVKSTALHERGQIITKLDSPRMLLGYAYIAKFRSDSLIKEVDTQKVLEGTIAINPSTRHQHTFSTSGAKPEDWYQIEIFVDPEIFNKLQPVYHQTPFAKPDSKSTVVVQRRMGVSHKPESLDDLALLARPDSYFTPDGTALTFYVKSVPADEWQSDKIADWDLWVKKIENLPFRLESISTLQ